VQYGTAAPQKTDGKLIAAGVLMFVQTAFLCIIGIFLVSVANDDNNFDDSIFDGLQGAITGVGLVLVALGAASCVAGVGCVKGRTWGKILTIVIQAIFLVLMIVGLLNDSQAGAGVLWPFIWLGTSLRLAATGKPRS
jgi:hypothetical protein